MPSFAALAPARVLAFLLGVTCSLVSAGQDLDAARVRELQGLADAQRDDWDSEKLELAALAHLRALSEAWSAANEQGVQPSFGGLIAGASRVDLGRASDAWQVHGEYEYQRWRALAPAPAQAAEGSSADEQLRAWLAPLRGARDLRCAWKIVTVEMRGAEFSTEVLLQASSPAVPLDEGGGPHRVQLNGRWALTWQVDATDTESGASSTELSLRSVVDRGSSCVRRRGMPFRERTDELELAAGASALLSLGAGEWQQRVDNMGEANFFGHNGTALADVDGDGRDDLYVAMGTGLPNLLFVRDAKGAWLERGLEAGVAWLDDTKGALFLDSDGDGDQDLLAAIGPAIVHSINDGRGHFTPVQSMRAASDAAFYSLAAADYDLDGDLDIYAVRYVKTSYGDSVPLPLHDARNGPPNHLLRNDGPAGFRDVTQEVGLGAGNDRFSLAAAWFDADGDGDQDLYVANDFGRNQLYRNQLIDAAGDGVAGQRRAYFTDVAATAGVEDQAAGMGIGVGDPDADGDFDLLVSNMYSSAGRRIASQDRFQAHSSGEARRGLLRHALGNSLFLNAGDGQFEDRSEESGLRMGRWAWGARFCDLDGDGLEDVHVPNGFLTGTRKDDL